MIGGGGGLSSHNFTSQPHLWNQLDGVENVFEF